jgi:hypothetical protein
VAAGLLAGGAAAPPARRPPEAKRPAVVADESTAVAQGLIWEIRVNYGGRDSWEQMDGLRYFITYTIPGPGGAPVRTWTESHHVWLHGEPRARIDVGEDSTIVIVAGDTTRVFRDGAWVGAADSTVIAAARDQALDLVWTWRLPRNLVNPAIRARQRNANVRGEPFTTRFHYERPGQGRPEGTVLDVTFAPPAYVMRRLHWYDPRTRAWFLLELADERNRYGWTWAERRTLHASNPAGEPGPVIWSAVVQDLQIEPAMPAVVLAPAGSGAGVVAVRAAAGDTTRTR